MCAKKEDAMKNEKKADAKPEPEIVTKTLFNKGQRVIITKSGRLIPEKTLKLPVIEAEKILKMYPREVLEMQSHSDAEVEALKKRIAELESEKTEKGQG